MSVNFGDVFETVARSVEPDAPAVICDRQVTSWSDFDARSNALGHALLGAGLGAQEKVALYMRNAPDYLIAFVACLKARLVPVNINFRYGEEEVAYLLENSDSEALIHDAEFEAIAGALAMRRPLKARIVRDGAGGDGPSSLAEIYAGPSGPIRMARDPEDIFLMYTGGTTGLPKGVMWPSSAVWGALAPSRAVPAGSAPPMTLDALAVQLRTGEGRARFLIAPPLMHGTGLFSALSIMSRGGSVVISSARTFDPAATVADLETLRCDGLVIVGDAFARPILDVLRAGGHDLRHMSAVVSSGMMWSAEVKQGLLEFMPDAVMSDGLGATESSSIAFAVTTRDTQGLETRFAPNGAVVLRPDDLTPVSPGSGEVGLVAKAGDLPLGYYKDPERTARTYVTLDGVRHMVSGDHATVEADGTMRLLGRGSHCINTAGEKVFPEEVEEALKTHPIVTDALVFGLPDPRFGQTVAALVAVREPVGDGELAEHVRARLAGYKVPRRIALAAAAPRAPNGKADYTAARTLFDQLTAEATRVHPG